MVDVCMVDAMMEGPEPLDSSSRHDEGDLRDTGDESALVSATYR